MFSAINNELDPAMFGVTKNMTSDFIRMVGLP